MRRALTALGLAALAGLGLFWLLTRPAALPAETVTALGAQPGDATSGERVFWAAGCAGCHTAPDLAADAPTEARLELGGGRRFASDFGTFLAPNVSTDPDEGIGRWTLEEFAAALMLGVSPGGAHYYPALPYTSYARADPADIADLWAFWQTLPAIATPSQPHELGFPFSIRRGLGLWKRLYLDAGFVTAPSGEATRDRGRYLVEALGHCAECHTPRDAFGGLDRTRWMAGAANPSGEGRIPALPPDGWSAEDIVAYLASGFTPEFDVVGGAMVAVVAHLSRLPESDRQAIAAYLHALPAP